MCGIAGLITREPDALPRLARAEEVQGHRGPDARSRIALERRGRTLALAHQRLSIIDLSDAGTQPMRRNDDWIVFNGEIYNYIELREELAAAGERFSTATDTEVLLAALDHWGVEGALQRFNGMFAFAWFDAAAETLYLCRDRAGIKPLNLCVDGDDLLFASEQKAILAMARGRFTLNYQALGEYLGQSLIESTPSTFLSEITKVPAGHYGKVALSGDALTVELVRYWSPRFEPAPETGLDELADEIRELFIDAVRLRLRSDVPVGVLLSGGVDSSAICAAVQQVRGKDADLNLLSAVSAHRRFDESPFIDRMAAHLGRRPDKVTLEFSAQRAFELLERVTWHNDQPVGGFSSVAHYLLLQRAKEIGITVVLSGQGADELLCGYKKYYLFRLQQLAREGRYLDCAAAVAHSLREGTILRQFNVREGKRYMPGFLTRRDADMAGEAVRDYEPPELRLPRGMTIQQRQALDVSRFSVPALLHYEDRMSMASSREIRVPFLDHRLIETLVPLPPETKIRRGWTKYVFRKAVEPLVPAEIVWRRDKMGFNNPEPEWLKNELRPTVLEYFAEDALIFRKRIVDRGELLRRYAAFCRQPSGRGRIWYKEIFNPLAIEVWLRQTEGYLG